MPPKRRFTLSATRIGSGLAAPGSRATWASAVVASTDIDRQLLLVAHDPLWSEDDQHHQGHTHHDPAELLDLRAGHDRGRDDVTPDRADEHQHRPEQHRPEHG